MAFWLPSSYETINSSIFLCIVVQMTLLLVLFLFLFIYSNSPLCVFFVCRFLYIRMIYVELLSCNFIWSSCFFIYDVWKKFQEAIFSVRAVLEVKLKVDEKLADTNHGNCPEIYGIFFQYFSNENFYLSWKHFKVLHKKVSILDNLSHFLRKSSSKNFFQTYPAPSKLP